MAVASQPAGHMIDAGAGVHHHTTSLELGEELDRLLAFELHAQQGFAMPILAVHVEAVLAETDPDERNVGMMALYRRRAGKAAKQAAYPGLPAMPA